ncbi:SDR family oxidoreductase [Nocardioides sp. QY071]|uniref:SDR family NAD(P)-dependent oxidoreductase n=1 Tax=Nocardioides sp. QY071 TaxID=3044187 RepID=UPI00249AB77D|nr:SDR family oxidoreductase [Nocardioides sp. QY071]WGY01648.1 SDR family oxidoreductase [Nocardioides sp. QY071]
MSHERLSLEGSVAVVTGAASGMGAEHVRMLTRRGARVVAVDVDADVGRVVAEAGDAAVAHVGDVSELSDWHAIRDLAVQLGGRLSVLVNNAGILGHRRIAMTEKSSWDRVLDVNLKGTWLGMKILAPAMRDAGGGSIVNVSSAAGLDQHPDVAYTASKWGVRGITKTGAQEFGRWGIRVNSIHPGYIDTAMTSSVPTEVTGAMLSLLPIARPGETRDVAELVAFLASDAAAFITGAEIAIDGGWTSGVQVTASRRPR